MTTNLNAPGTVQAQLNRSTPAAAKAKMGDVLADLVTQINALETQVASLTTKFNAVLAKLDADAGVTDTNYTALEAVAAFSATTVLDVESRFPGA